MKITAAEFNAKYPVGTPCRYFSVLGGDAFIDTRTRSPAWETFGGMTIVSVEKVFGGVSVSHLVMKPTTPSPIHEGELWVVRRGWMCWW